MCDASRIENNQRVDDHLVDPWTQQFIRNDGRFQACVHADPGPPDYPPKKPLYVLAGTLRGNRQPLSILICKSYLKYLEKQSEDENAKGPPPVIVRSDNPEPLNALIGMNDDAADFLLGSAQMRFVEAVS